MIVVDASVLIAHLDASDAQHDRAAARLLAVAEHRLGASTITLAEVLVGPARMGRADAAADALRRLGLTEVPLPPDGASRLARLRAETRLMLPDCCVLLAADEAVLTFDERLARAAEQRGLAAV